MNPESSWWGNLIQNFPWILVPDSSLRESLPKDSQRASGVVWGLANSGTWEAMPEGGFVHVEREGAKWTGGMPHDVKKGKWRHSCWQWEHREVKVPFWQSQLFSLSPPCLSSQASAAKFPAHRQGSGRGFFLPARARYELGFFLQTRRSVCFPAKWCNRAGSPDASSYDIMDQENPEWWTRNPVWEKESLDFLLVVTGLGTRVCFIRGDSPPCFSLNRRSQPV